MGPNMQAATFFNALSLLCLPSLMGVAAVEDLINQINAVNDSTGYKSDFKESRVEGIKQLEEDFFPHEDLVRLAPQTSPRPNSTNSGVWRPQSGRLLAAAISLSAIIGKGCFGI